MIVSTRKIGHQIKSNPNDLVNVVEDEFKFLIK